MDEYDYSQRSHSHHEYGRSRSHGHDQDRYALVNRYTSPDRYTSAVRYTSPDRSRYSRSPSRPRTHRSSHESHESHEGRRSRSDDRSVSDRRNEKEMHHVMKSALLAGAIEAFRVRNEPGSWTSGNKGGRVATAALGAAVIDTARDKDPYVKSKRHAVEAAAGGLLTDRIVNGKRK